MEKRIIRFSLKNIGYIFLVALLIAGIAKTIFDTRKVFTKSYQIDVKKLVPIDTFILQGKIDYLRTGRGTHDGYEFKSNTGYYFSITGSSFEGIVNKNDLEKHLTHHGLKFIAYSNRETLNKYLSTTIPFGINVFQIQIRDKKYIDIETGNSNSRKKLFFLAIAELLLTVAFSFWLIKIKKNNFK